MQALTYVPIGNFLPSMRARTAHPSAQSLLVRNATACTGAGGHAPGIASPASGDAASDNMHTDAPRQRRKSCARD